MLFLLDVAIDKDAGRATLRLADEDGIHLGANEVALRDHPPSLWEGLFDTRRHVTRMRGVAAPEEQLAKLGAFLGEHVLGPEISAMLAEGIAQRTLLVRLPDPTQNDLAAAFARVPWEIAHAKGDDTTLLDRNVVVRAVPEGAASGRGAAIPLEPGKPVRVLLVFAEAPDSNPLAVRLERERLREMFFAEVLPTRNVEFDVLCHGVTRRRLMDQVKEHGGYHVVHWSGHGHVDALEIALDEGEKAAPRLSGKELVGLFQNSGGFIPPVVFLSACHSGAMLTAKDWASLEAAIAKEQGGARQGEAAQVVLDEMVKERVGFTGTALSLVQAGVKQVVAMRYEVGDRYARRLAKRFYRHLLADKKHHAVDEALALARGELAGDKARAAEYEAVDKANPLVFGAEPVRIEPKGKRSAQMEKRAPKPQPLLQSGSKELDPPFGFVGRGEELTELGRKWLDPEGAPIALIQGLAGLGKTSLAAEAIHLWFDRFDYVFCFQAKGGALASVEELYRRLDQRLALSSAAYRERCQGDEMARVFLDTSVVKGAERYGKLAHNLADTMSAERVLLVLDNVETNLMKSGGPEYASQDPAWDGLFEVLGNRLRGTGSRVLVTSRHKLAALRDNERALWVPLGPLPMGEARLFFEGQRPLRELVYGDEEGKRLAWRILDVSRGHPLILGRIADLARAYHDKTYGLTPAGRKALGEALDRIRGDGFRVLPDVFAGAKTDKEREQERAYLEDVAIGAVDLLIERLGEDARRLLWVVTRAGEPTMESMIAGVWSGESAEDEMLREIAQLVGMLDKLPPEIQAQIRALPPVVLAKIEGLQSRPQAPPVTPLLDTLCASGLLVRDGSAYTFHDLVAERAEAWMKQHPGLRGGRTEADIWTAYGTRYGAVFHALVADAKRDRASEAGQRGIRYLVRARAFEALQAFASGVITGTNDPALLGQVITDLQAAAGEVPAGEARWCLRADLADALHNAGQADQALALYQQAAEEAEAAEHWADLAAIYGNWANALRTVGQIDAARAMQLKSADAARRADLPPIHMIGHELEALRLDVMQGRAGEALPAIEAKLCEVRAWWASRQRDDEFLARVLMGGLDIARQANLALERWQPCLDLLGEVEQVKRALGTGDHEMARTRFNLYVPLMELGKLAEAKAVLEGCLNVFHRTGDVTNEAKALSALASVWDTLGDPAQPIALARRALSLRERLPDPHDRAASHNNLAVHLHDAGATAEALAHQLAALAYRLATGLDPHDSLQNLALGIRQSAARGETFTFPALADLLATPAFAPLRAFLAERQIPTPALQATIDDLVARTRAAVLSPPDDPPPTPTTPS